MKKTIGILVIVAIVLIAIFTGNKKVEGVKKVGIIQYGDHQAWLDVKKGIIDTLSE
jgi:ABC-type uncharacterized transport system substrate-binding protein